MNSPDKLIAEIIEAGEGEIVGRIRLQKILYLLDQKGLAANAHFHYHHYGPYSRILDGAIEKAKALRGLTEEIRHRRDGATYSVFKMASSVERSDMIGGLPRESVVNLIRLMKARTATVLEIAATIHWLAKVEKLDDWQTELVRRKGVKAENGRTPEALELLAELGLSPAN